MKRRVLRIEPWGKPVIISRQILTIYIFEICLNKLLSKPNALNFVNNGEWSQLSNAFDKSIKRAPTLTFLFKTAFHFSIITSRAFSLLWFLRNPVRCFENLFYIYFVHMIIFQTFLKRLRAYSLGDISPFHYRSLF